MQVLDEALRLHRSLCANIFPIPRGSKVPSRPWKDFQHRKLSADEIAALFESEPDSNIAVVCGRISNLLVLDADAPEALKRMGCGVPVTPIAETSRGRHYYFSLPNRKIRTATLADGLDLRAEGAYVIAPPSVHPSGKQYEWLIPYWEAELSPPPPWLLNMLKQRRAQVQSADRISEIVHGVPEGRRNLSSAQLIGLLLAHLPPDLWEDVVWPIVLGWNQLNKPPLSERDLRYTFDCIARKESRRRRAREERQTDLLEKFVDFVSKNLSQTQIARALNVHQSSVSRLLKSLKT